MQKGLKLNIHYNIEMVNYSFGSLS